MVKSIRSRQPERGPRRKRSSTVKLRCFYKGCRNVHVDVKNMPFHAQLNTLEQHKLRKVRPQACVARFCCKEHLAECSQRARKHGAREPLTSIQAIHLFHVLRSVAPWAAVMYLLAVVTGERVGAVCQACATWFSGMDPKKGDPPRLRIPRVNLKTNPRQIALQGDFARLLWSWVADQPLSGGRGDRLGHWPHPGQAVSFAQAPTRLVGKRSREQLLFPGRDKSGERQWRKPITEKAFYNTFKAAQAILRSQRKDAHAKGQAHAFDDVALERLTSHSCKKTAATLLSEHTSMAVIASITGTTARILLDRYVCPTSDLQRRAVTAAFRPVLDGVQPVEPAARPGTGEGCHNGGLTYCTRCSFKQQSTGWLYCPACGAQYVAASS